MNLEKATRWRVAQKHEKEFWSRFWREKLQKNEVIIKGYYRLHYEIIRRFYLVKNGDVLEIGGGALPFIKYCFDGKAILLDPLMDYYKSNFCIPNVQTIKAIGEDMPFPINSFDLVICMNTLDHVRDPHNFLLEVNNVLKEGGILYLTVNCYDPPSKYYRLFKEFLRFFEDKQHPYVFTLKEVGELLEGARFNVLTIHRSVGDLYRFIRHRTLTRDGIKSGQINSALDYLRKWKILNIIDAIIAIALSFRGEIIFEEDIQDFIFMAKRNM